MRKSNQKASSFELVTSYKELGNVWKVADSFGMCGQSVHERLAKLGVINPKNIFSDQDRAFLMENYTRYRDANNLKELAEKMGRTKQFICRQAKKLGLTDISQCYKDVDIVVDFMGYERINGPSKKIGSTQRHAHRLIAENKICRKIKKGEVVHHIDGDKTNNSEDNIMVMSRINHMRYHTTINNPSSKRWADIGEGAKTVISMIELETT